MARRGILHGMRVVEVSAFVAVPLGGMHLAALGADVIRVDPIGGGIDYGRWPVTGDGHSLYWAGLNKAKRSVALDLRSDAGRDLVRRLAGAPGRDGGIVITNLDPPWLGYEALAAERADLIMVVLEGNPDGSIAVDYTVNAAVGYPLITGDGEAPVNHVLPAWDVVAGSLVATAVLAAERHRDRTGEGQLVRLSLADVALSTVGNLGHLAEVEINDTDRPAFGNFVFGQFGKDFATSDGRRVMVAALTPRQWASLVEATGSGEAMTAIAAGRSLDLTLEGDRFAAREEIADVLAPWFAARPFKEVAQGLTDHNVLWGPYQSFRQLLTEDPRASEANPMFTRIHQPGVGTYLAPGSPLRFGALAPGPALAAPELGADTVAVLHDVLGLDEDKVTALRKEGVL
ncbi:MAG: CoA transferase [Acidimicrobiia bacterium]